MEKKYEDDIPRRHRMAALNWSRLSALSFKGAEAVVHHASIFGANLDEKEQEDLRLRIADVIEKELRLIRRGQ